VKKKACPSLITRESVRDTLPVLEEAGFRPNVVGSVATKGCSEHDIDVKILLPDGSYKAYQGLLEALGWKLLASVDDHMENDLETWKRRGVVLDVWLEE
jgi:hypothetical protein